MSKQRTVSNPTVVLVAVAMLGSLACATPKPQEAYAIAQPKTEVARTLTSFSGSLRCMDDLFVSHGVEGFEITSIGIPDATGQVSVGARDMLISAISRMTRRSRAFSYTDFELNRTELNYLYENSPNRQSQAPTHYIRGAITQLDQNVTDWRKGGGLAAQVDIVGADVAVDWNETVSVLALDMSVGVVESRRILSGLTASNSIAVARRGNAKEAGLSIKDVGAFFSIEMSQSEGMHNAVRALIELAAVELLGKLAKVPYWQCLNVEGTNPKVTEQVAEWYRDLDSDEKVLFVQRVLVANGYLYEATGAMDAQTIDAVARYELSHDLVPNGRIDFDLYREMLGSRRSLGLGAPKALAREELASNDLGAELAKAGVPVAGPVGVEIKNVRGSDPSYTLNETLQVAVVADDNAYLYCYYQDADGFVSRVFPNRFSPSAYVASGERVEIPTRNAPFEILFEVAGSREELLCVGSDRELGALLPQSLDADLEPLPVASNDRLVGLFEELDRSGLGVARLPIQVTGRP